MRTRFKLVQLAAATALLAVSSGQATRAQQAQLSRNAEHVALASTSSTAEQESSQPPAKAGHEGLKVHGHWKIVVRNPDGSLAKEIEFENALVTPGGGDIALASLLAGYLSAGAWEILVVPQSGSTGLCGGGSGTACIIAGANTLAASIDDCPSPGCAATLQGPTVTNGYGSGSSKPAQMQLQGSFVSSANTQIVQVFTQLVSCALKNVNGPSTVSPATCSTGTAGNAPAGTTFVGLQFTATSAAPLPISVSDGQTVSVQVIISFT